MKGVSLVPRDVVHSDFCGSRFNKRQIEDFLMCLAITQYRLNPEAWTPFSWEEYVAKCDHDPTKHDDYEVFKIMVSGGKIAGVIIEPGYLTQDRDGRYMITEKLLAVMSPYKKVKTVAVKRWRLRSLAGIFRGLLLNRSI